MTCQIETVSQDLQFSVSYVLSVSLQNILVFQQVCNSTDYSKFLLFLLQYDGLYKTQAMFRPYLCTILRQWFPNTQGYVSSIAGQFFCSAITPKLSEVCTGVSVVLPHLHFGVLGRRDPGTHHQKSPASCKQHIYSFSYPLVKFLLPCDEKTSLR